MTKVFTALAVSVDGYITGRNPQAGDGLGDGKALFDWYWNGETPSQVFKGFHLSEASARVFDGAASRIGAIVAGRTTYEDSQGFGGGSPHPTAPLVVLSHRPAPTGTERQTFVAGGIEAAIDAARSLAGDQDISLMGGAITTQALAAGLVDELVLHQVPILLGGGRSFFHELPDHIGLRLLEVVPAPGVTHLHYAVSR